MPKTAQQINPESLSAKKNTGCCIPYGRQFIDQDDIQAVVDVLKSDYLTTGPKIDEFEQAVADHVGSRYAIAVNSGTAALHCAMYALDIGPGDEVIVPAITFAATANCIIYQGGKPVFADVDPETLLIDPKSVINKISKKTKAIIAVDYAGQPCDYHQLQKISAQYNLKLVADACHSLGAKYNEQRTGALADLTVFSFHPVKHITTGEGGMITTDNTEYNTRIRRFRNHGIAADHHQRNRECTWHYDMLELGFNYRITDFQCALGISQLGKLERFVVRRQAIASAYDQHIGAIAGITPLTRRPGTQHAFHLYVVRVNADRFGCGRDELFQRLRENRIGVNVHYQPVYLHTYYRKRFGTGPGLCPQAERVYRTILSLPIWPGMQDKHIDTCACTLANIQKSYDPHEQTSQTSWNCHVNHHDHCRPSR